MPNQLKAKFELSLNTDNKPVATSRDVARYFNRPHKSILRLVESFDSDTISRHTYVPRDYIDSRGKEQKMYQLNEKAFVFLVMSLKGKKAESIKSDFIDMFYKLAKDKARQVKKTNRVKKLPSRTAASDANKMMTRATRLCRQLEGKAVLPRHYMTEQKLVNGVLTGTYGKIDRDLLDVHQERVLCILETRNVTLLAGRVPYKQRKAVLLAVRDFIEMVVNINRPQQLAVT